MLNLVVRSYRIYDANLLRSRNALTACRAQRAGTIHALGKQNYHQTCLESSSFEVLVFLTGAAKVGLFAGGANANLSFFGKKGCNSPSEMMYLSQFPKIHW
jgi:hypothetical protein